MDFVKKEKRGRCANYTPDETEALLGLVEKYKRKLGEHMHTLFMFLLHCIGTYNMYLYRMQVDGWYYDGRKGKDLEFSG